MRTPTSGSGRKSQEIQLKTCRERVIFAILIYPRKMDGLNSVFRFCDVYKIVYTTTEKIFRGTQPISRHCTAIISRQPKVIFQTSNPFGTRNFCGAYICETRPGVHRNGSEQCLVDENTFNC